MGWPPNTSSLKAARSWQKTFGDWSLGKCGSCHVAFFGGKGWRWSRLEVGHAQRSNRG
jgi:hypothetical protein